MSGVVTAVNETILAGVILTLSDVLPMNPWARTSSIAATTGFLLLFLWVITGFWSGSDSRTSSPSVGRQSRLALWVGLFVRPVMLLFRSPSAPQLWVIIILVAILAAVSTPAILHRREESRKVHATNRLRQLGQGLSNYHDTFLQYPVAPKEHGATDRADSSQGANDVPTKLVSPLVIVLPVLNR